MSTRHSIPRLAGRTKAWALPLLALAAWGASPVTQAADWVSIAKSDRTEVFANPATLGVSPASWVIVRTKQNFVEPQPSAKKGDIVVAIVDGQFTLKRLDIDRGEFFLRAENKAYAPIRPEGALEIFGVMVGLVRKM